MRVGVRNARVGARAEMTSAMGKKTGARDVGDRCKGRCKGARTGARGERQVQGLQGQMRL